MIVRMWEVRVVPGRLREFCDLLTEGLWGRLRGVDGFLGGELFASADGEDRVVVLTRWRDQAALEAAAGPGWRTTALLTAAERGFVVRPPHLWHFVPVSAVPG